MLDRESGEFLLGKPFTRQGLDDKGRPIVIPNTDPTPEENYVCPDATGGMNWASPSWDPRTKLLYIAARDSCSTYKTVTKPPVPDLPYKGTSDQADDSIGGKGLVEAIDPFSGDVRCKYKLGRGFRIGRRSGHSGRGSLRLVARRISGGA